MISWEAYGEELWRFITRRIQNRMDAEDVLQDVLFKAYRKKHQVMDDAKFRGWVYQIARNTIIDYYRSKRRALLPIDDWDSILQAPDETPDEEVALLDCLVSLITALPEKYRSALVAADLQEVPQVLLSSQLGLSYSGTKSRVQRGRQKLRHMLEELCSIEVNQYREVQCTPQSEMCCA